MDLSTCWWSLPSPTGPPFRHCSLQPSPKHRKRQQTAPTFKLSLRMIHKPVSLTPLPAARVRTVNRWYALTSLTTTHHTTGLHSDARFPSIADYHAAYKAGTTTPTDVAKAIIQAIKTQAACASVFIAHDPDHVLQQAADSTARWAAGRSLGPLDGGRQPPAFLL